MNGDIFSEGGVHIGGEVTGSVEAKTYAIVAPSAIIYGSLHAAEVYLSGHVKGDIWALEMEISDAGSCDGAIFAFKINGEFTTK
ncbi:bactofilin family protein [Hydrogenimonas sp.]